MHRLVRPRPASSLLTLAGHPADWRSLATALTSGGRPVLSDLLRAELASTPHHTPAERLSLSFVPAHAAAIQRTAAMIGIRLAASPSAA